MKLPDSAVDAAAQQLGGANDWPLYIEDAKAAILAFLEAAKNSGDAQEGHAAEIISGEYKGRWGAETWMTEADGDFPVIILRVQP